MISEIDYKIVVGVILYLLVIIFFLMILFGGSPVWLFIEIWFYCLPLMNM